jgi:hypothetical protein
MKINLFEFFIILIITIGTVYLWYKYKLEFVTNYIIGGGVLIFLCQLDFLGWEGSWGKFGVLILLFMFITYTLLNISTLFIYLFKNKKNKYFMFPAIMFLIIGIFLFLITDVNITFKWGALVRLFLAFFSLQFYTYYKKHLRIEQTENMRKN